MVLLYWTNVIALKTWYQAPDQNRLKRDEWFSSYRRLFQVLELFMHQLRAQQVGFALLRAGRFCDVNTSF